jgi:hypothetical protein
VVAHIVEKMVENRLGWFGHLERSIVDSVVRRLDQMEGIQIIRGRGRPRKTTRETVMKDLEINELAEPTWVVLVVLAYDFGVCSSTRSQV